MLFVISDDDLDTNRIIIKSNNGNTNHNSALDTLNDLDNEEAALHEFDFLSHDNAATTSRKIEFFLNCFF